MPRREAKFSVSTRPDELWKFLRDFESLCTCIPGVERIEVQDGRTARLTVKEKLGVVPLVVELTARIDAEDPPRRLQATATAEHLTMAIEIALEPSASGCDLLSVFDVRGEGPMKPIVDRLFEKRATERSEQFAACLQARFGAQAPAAPEPAPAPRPGGWLARLARWWQRLTSAS